MHNHRKVGISPQVTQIKEASSTYTINALGHGKSLTERGGISVKDYAILTTLYGVQPCVKLTVYFLCASSCVPLKHITSKLTPAKA